MLFFESNVFIYSSESRNSLGIYPLIALTPQNLRGLIFFPVGLCGLLIIIILVFEEHACSIRSQLVV
jgi:hypothetical protein